MQFVSTDLWEVKLNDLPSLGLVIKMLVLVLNMGKMMQWNSILYNNDTI